MNLETAVCLLAAAAVIAGMFSIMIAYMVNQQTARNYSLSLQNLQSSQTNALIAERLANLAEKQKHEQNI